MISVRQACQDLADGDAASEGLGIAEMDLEEAGEAGAEAEVTSAGQHDGGQEKGAGEEGRDGDDEGAAGVKSAAGAGASAEGGNSKNDESGGGSDGGGVGVPLSVACSEDGKTVAVVVSG